MSEYKFDDATLALYTKYIADAVKRSYMPRIHNRNCLDNWLFTRPINQRGFSVRGPKTVEGNDVGYTIDRWAWVQFGKGSATLTEDGIVLTETEGVWNDHFIQRVEASFFRRFKGRYITISLLYKGTGEYGDIYCQTNGTIVDPTLLILDGTTRLATYTMKVPYDISLDSYNESFVITVRNASVTAIAAGFEPGTVQTLAYQDAEDNWIINDPSPDTIVELLKCQDCFYDTGYTTKYRAAQYDYSVNKLWITVPTPVKMRAKPTIVSIGTSILYDVYSSGPSEITGYGVEDYSSNGVTIWIQAPTIVQPNEKMVILQNMQLSADI